MSEWVCTRCEMRTNDPGVALRHDCRGEEMEQLRAEIGRLRPVVDAASAYEESIRLAALGRRTDREIMDAEIELIRAVRTRQQEQVDE